MIHWFEITLEGADFVSEESDDADALYEAGCDDTVPMHDGPLVRVLFYREAETFNAAVASAVLAIGRSLPHVRIMRIERRTDMEEPGLPHSA
ncbi:MAG TPA: hypothetical protein VE547_04270 [Mycobacteriales bacterium]|jgi:hypothetical protein|nr:hypothetical protein [Mycobacteriales bacterium]